MALYEESFEFGLFLWEEGVEIVGEDFGGLGVLEEVGEEYEAVALVVQELYEDVYVIEITVEYYKDVAVKGGVLPDRRQFVDQFWSQKFTDYRGWQ